MQMFPSFLCVSLSQVHALSMPTGQLPGPGDTKRQKLAAPTGKSFKLQCFGVKYDCKDLPRFDYTMDCCQFLEMQFDHVGHHDGLLETFIQSHAFPHLMQDILAFVKNAKEGCSTIGVFSDRGRHRSVALAWCVQVLLQHMGLPCETDFLEKKRGHWLGMCHSCEKCSLQSPFKERIAKRLPEWFQQDL